MGCDVRHCVTPVLCSTKSEAPEVPRALIHAYTEEIFCVAVYKEKKKNKDYLLYLIDDTVDPHLLITQTRPLLPLPSPPAPPGQLLPQPLLLLSRTLYIYSAVA